MRRLGEFLSAKTVASSVNEQKVVPRSIGLQESVDGGPQLANGWNS